MPLLGKPKWNNSILAYLVPPREDMPFQSPRILIFSRTYPEIRHEEGFSLPGQIVHDPEIMKRELCDPDHLPCVVVQIDEDNQFMFFIMDDSPPEVHRILNCRIDEVEDRAEVPGLNQSPIILPGQNTSPAAGGKLIIPGLSAPGVGGYTGDEIWRIELDWQTTEEADPDVVNLVRRVAIGAKVI